MGPVVNYWRFGSYHTLAHKCLNEEACLGTMVEDSSGLYCKERLNDTFCYTGWCDSKYQGNLCATCAPGHGISNQVDCVACSNNPVYYIVLVIILIMAIFFIVYTVKGALKIKKAMLQGKGRPKSSIYMKIFFNYVQLVSIVSSFQFKWPKEVEGMFTYQNRIASSASEVFSVDCLLPSFEGNSIRPFFIKMIIISLSPILLLIGCIVIWLIIYKIQQCRKKIKFDKPNYWSNVITTIVVLLFMIHTTLVQNTILGFR